MNDSALLRLLSEASNSCEAETRFQQAILMAQEIETAARAFPTAVVAWQRDRSVAPLHDWPDSTKEALVYQSLSEAHRYIVLAKALVHEAHAEARGGHARDL